MCGGRRALSRSRARRVKEEAALLLFAAVKALLEGLQELCAVHNSAKDAFKKYKKIYKAVVLA